MASLLPHKTLAYKGTDVLVDGKSSIASERDGIPQSVGGLACKCDELMAKKKDVGREFVKDTHLPRGSQSRALPTMAYAELKSQLEEIAKMLSGLITGLENRQT